MNKKLSFLSLNIGNPSIERAKKQCEMCISDRIYKRKLFKRINKKYKIFRISEKENYFIIFDKT